MGQKGHIMDQKGLKMHEKRQKIEFSNLKYLLFSRVLMSKGLTCSLCSQTWISWDILTMFVYL